MPREKCIFKLIRKGAYECGAYLIVRRSWISDRWDGPQQAFRKWRVYAEGSHIERQMMIDGFVSLKDACRHVERLMELRP